MKKPSLAFIAAFAALAALPYAGCKPQPPPLTPEQQTQEIDRRVAQKVAEEKVSLQQQQLDQKAQDIAAREQQVAQREQSLAQTTPQPTSQPTPEATTTGAPANGLTVAATQSSPDEGQDGDVGVRTSGAYDRFYSELAPQGEWIESHRYGLVWQPSIALQGDWRPYTAGHWAYARNGGEEIGWTWMSDEPFGWAVYHYGRWTTLPGAGWVWVPGRRWAPAWVSWRKTPEHVGWAPLPPETGMRVGISIGAAVDVEFGIAASAYAFVPAPSFGDPDLRVALIPAAQNVAIVNKSVNVTNITTVNNVNNTTVINRGPSIAQVSSASNHPIPVVPFTRKSSPVHEGTRTAGQGIAIPTSALPATVGPTHLPTVKRHLADPGPVAQPRRGTANGTQGLPPRVRPVVQPEVIHSQISHAPAASVHVPADAPVHAASVHVPADAPVHAASAHVPADAPVHAASAHAHAVQPSSQPPTAAHPNWGKAAAPASGPTHAAEVPGAHPHPASAPASKPTSAGAAPTPTPKK